MLCFTLGVALISSAPKSVKSSPKLNCLRGIFYDGAITVVETSDVVPAVKFVKFAFLALFLVFSNLVFNEIFSLLP